MQCENGCFDHRFDHRFDIYSGIGGWSDLIPFASSQILSDTSLGLGAADDGDHFYPSHIYPDKSLPGKMSTRTNVDPDKCLPAHLYTWTSVCPDKCLPWQMSDRTHIPRQVSAQTSGQRPTYSQNVLSELDSYTKKESKTFK